MGRLTAELVESFSGVYLSPRYDQPQPTPDLHRECWEAYCSDDPQCMRAAPRNHAKSTGLTHDYGTSVAVFREECYIILIGSTEEMAIEHLGDMANEFRENEPLRRDFKIKGLLTDSKTDIIVECTDGYQFRILARGAEQKIRGRKWRGRRPGLIICDDLEDDEQVENKDRRAKFRRWFFRAVKQALRDGGKIRIHGTILHEDSLLMRLSKDPTWNSKVYKAHKSFTDFSEILWPEKFPISRLKSIRETFIKAGDPTGYAQEYLNDPRDNEDAFIRREDILPMRDEHRDQYMEFGCGVDFAISKADTANKTSFTVGGKDLGNVINIIDQRADRMDALEIIDEFFSVGKRYDCTFFAEGGQIWKAIEPMLRKEMARRDCFLNIVVINPTKDKKVRGRAFQKRSRGGGLRADQDASWFADWLDIILRFTGDADAIEDDEFDSTAILCLGMEGSMPDLEDDDAITEEELDEIRASNEARSGGGRSLVTGY